MEPRLAQTPELQDAAMEIVSYLLPADQTEITITYSPVTHIELYTFPGLKYPALPFGFVFALGCLPAGDKRDI
jgi:hypothetical protein